MLFFDEADALFGKRSEVKDAHDRYANVEIAYLLQRMELFDGIAILATNLRANIDEAFARRLDAVVDFPMPGRRASARDSGISACGPACRARRRRPRLLREAFELSGGNIRNIAARRAPTWRPPATARSAMPELMRATEREYRKLGRLCTPSEFGPYYDLVSETDNA